MEPKSDVIQMRVEPELKEQIERAAARCGLSVSAFVLQAARRAAKESPMQVDVDSRSRGVPSFFRALCATAARGGRRGYWAAGYELARHTDDILGGVADDDFEQLRQAVRGDLSAVVEWYERRLPRCVRLVPARRRLNFAEGVVDFHRDDGTYLGA